MFSVRVEISLWSERTRSNRQLKVQLFLNLRVLQSKIRKTTYATIAIDWATLKKCASHIKIHN